MIENLKKLKTKLPEYNFFGGNNWEPIDAQISILEGTSTYYDYEDEEDDIESASNDIKDWMNGDKKFSV